MRLFCHFHLPEIYLSCFTSENLTLYKQECFITANARTVMFLKVGKNALTLTLHSAEVNCLVKFSNLLVLNVLNLQLIVRLSKLIKL